MEDFTKEIKEHNLRKALEIEAIGNQENQENQEFIDSVDEVTDTLNKSLEDGLIGRAEYERDFDNLDQIIQKARPHKYIKREGTPGNYKYYYTLEEYKAAKGGAVDTTEGKKTPKKEEGKKKEKLLEEIDRTVNDGLFEYGGTFTSIKSKIKKIIDKSIGKNDLDISMVDNKYILITLTAPSPTFLEEFVKMHVNPTTAAVDVKETYLRLDINKLKDIISS